MVPMTATARRRGIVSKWFESKGYGFLRLGMDEDDALLHISELPAGARVEVGATIECAVIATERGPRATKRR
ncbi:MAG TPA: cold shock domain-containing protein [Vicinamibacterales bacterium]